MLIICQPWPLVFNAKLIELLKLKNKGMSIIYQSLPYKFNAIFVRTIEINVDRVLRFYIQGSKVDFTIFSLEFLSTLQ